MNYWLVKTEPGEFSWNDLLRDQKATWDGVRNYQARNNLRGMKNGDAVLVYHSQEEKQVRGIAEVIRESFPDPTTSDERWLAVEIRPTKELKKPVHLSRIRSSPALAGILLVRNSRLSVMPLVKSEFDEILKIAEEDSRGS